MRLYEHHTDQQLLSLLKSDDRQAFNELYERYKSRIYGISLQLLKSEVLAGEILQDVFVKVWLYRHRIRPDRSFPSYLFRIAENRVMDLYRNAARDQKLLDRLVAVTPDSFSLEELLLQKERMTTLNGAIAKLPPQRKRVFTLCKLEGKSYEEVGRELGITVATVNDHIVKATRAVKASFFSSQEIAILLLIASNL